MSEGNRFTENGYFRLKRGLFAKMMYLIAQAESLGMPGIVQVSLREIRRELQMPRRTIYNALERLIDQDVIRKI